MNDTRERSERSSRERKKYWAPPNRLEAPPVQDGYKYRWVRTSVRGEDDTMNVISRARQHYEPVMGDEFPGFQVPTIEDGKLQGAVTVGDMILMKCPENVAQERRDFFKAKSDALQESVDQQLRTEGNNQYTEITPLTLPLAPVATKTSSNVQPSPRRT